MNDKARIELPAAIPFCLNSLSSSQRWLANDALLNWENSSDADVVEALRNDGFTDDQCQAVLSFRDRALTSPLFHLFDPSECLAAF